MIKTRLSIVSINRLIVGDGDHGKLVARNYRVLSPEHFIVGGVFTSPRQALLTPALLTRYLPHLTSAYTA